MKSKTLALVGLLALVGAIIAVFAIPQTRTIAIGALEDTVAIDALPTELRKGIARGLQALPFPSTATVIDPEGYEWESFTMAGFPHSEEPLRFLANDGYAIGFSDSENTPIWVAYHLRSVDWSEDNYKRPDSFDVDWRTPYTLAETGWYTNSGYDRGHLAPNATIMQYFGRDAQIQTFLMSNIVPQPPELNRGPWADLEAVIRDRAEYAEDLWVITGPVFTNSPTLLAGQKIPVPFGYFTLVTDILPDQSGLFAAYFIPSDLPNGTDYSNYLTTVDHIEELTGLDFFQPLADTAETAYESIRMPLPSNP